MVNQLKQEISILKTLHHPHIVNLKEVLSSKENIFVVVELVTGGELFDKIALEGPMKEKQAQIIFSQILSAIEYCHSKGVYHRDIKPENILLTSVGTVKLSDFGLGTISTDALKNKLLDTTCGTPNYVAPEVLRKQGYDGAPADIWSLGVCLYVTLAGCLPFDEDDLPTLFSRIESAKYAIPPWLSRNAVDIIDRMIQRDPVKRATTTELWAHPWMEGAKKSDLGIDIVSIMDPNQEEEVFKEAVMVEESPNTKKLSGQVSAKKLNLFQLLGSNLDISGLFEQRDDVITRRTRFTTDLPLNTLIAALESAAVATGGKVELQPEDHSMRITTPHPQGTLRALVEIFEMFEGKNIVDCSKITGSSPAFYRWYHDLLTALGPVAQSAKMQKRNKKEASIGVSTGGIRSLNAFELLSNTACFNLGALFESKADGRLLSSNCQAQFTSRATPEQIMTTLKGAVLDIGGDVSFGNGMHATIDSSENDASRNVKIAVSLKEILPGVYLVRLRLAYGSSLEFYRFYGQLSRHLSHIMTQSKESGRVAHPQSVAGILASPMRTGLGKQQEGDHTVESARENTH